MLKTRLVALTTLAMLAFAANSLLCRAALKDTAIDPASFTGVRLLSGAVALYTLTRWQAGPDASIRRFAATWTSALLLFIYAAGFSFAYIHLSAATGALLLFAAVQVTMIGYGLYQGERLSPLQVAGMVIALVGLVYLLSPGLTAPQPAGSALMILAGVAWGAYSLRAKGVEDPIGVTAGNFLRAVPLTLLLSLLFIESISFDKAGLGYAIASGALASGAGYAIWYAVLPWISASNAATIQLSVPVIATFAGSLLLAEPITLRLLVASLTILGGVAMVIRKNPRASPELIIHTDRRTDLC